MTVLTIAHLCNEARIFSAAESAHPERGYLTISPAMQWRLQYKRVMAQAGGVDGVRSVYRGAV